MAKQKQSKKESTNQFVIYDVVISRNPELDMLIDLDGKTALDKASEIFGSFFENGQKQLQLWRKNKKKEDELDKYPNDILTCHENVYLLRINNIKYTKITEKADTTTMGTPDYKEQTRISNPYCYVVVDNRSQDNICQIAIQKNSAWGDPNNVRLLLEENLRKQISTYYPLTLDITPRMRPSKIWEFCRQQCMEGGDTITKISFEFPNQKKIALANRIPKEQRKGYIRKLAEIAEKTEALKTLISMEYSSTDPKQLEKQAKDWSNIIHLCRNKKYNLTINFRDYGKYRCDSQVRAMFPMQEELLMSFWTKWEELPFEEKWGLFNWCNYVNDKSKMYAEQTDEAANS